MRLAQQSDIPDLVAQLKGPAPDLEALVLTRNDDPGQRIATDASLCSAARGTNFPILIKNCEGPRWIHILGTGIDIHVVAKVRSHRSSPIPSVIL